MKKNLFAALAIAAALFASCQKPDNGGNNNGGGINNGGVVDETLHPSLQGSAYVPIYMNGYGREMIENKIVLDLSVNDTDKFLWLWNGYQAIEHPEGLNFYEDEGYLSLQVTGADGWSGGGFCAPNELKEGDKVIGNLPPVESFVKDDLESWYLHFAYKPNDLNDVHAFIVVWAGKEKKYGLAGDFEDNGQTYKEIKPISNDGELVKGKWNEYEIPLNTMGIDFSQKHNGNYITFLSGANPATRLSLDAIFFYKK